jgi:ArsR family metal-binding transcriptional regulator
MRDRIIDTLTLKNLLLDVKGFGDITESSALGVVKAKSRDADVSVMASGRVVVRGASDESTAKEILEDLAPHIKQAIK